jgi:hypothetical protein
MYYQSGTETYRWGGRILLTSTSTAQHTGQAWEQQSLLAAVRIQAYQL